MRTNFIFLLIIFTLCFHGKNVLSQITFSEVMYDVATNEYHDEFIEIFNQSHQDSIKVQGWTFSDSSGIDNILVEGGGQKIAPRHFALLLDGSYFNNSTTYDTLITDSLVLLKIEDNSFGNNGLSNSKAEWLTIRDSTGQIIAEYKYSLGNRPGYSDEKIDLDETNDSLNWSDSRIKGGTPGKRNSVSPPLFDMGFEDNSLIFPVLMFAEDQIVFTLKINDYGLASAADSLDLFIFSDANQDEIYQESDFLISHMRLPTIAQTIVFKWNNAPAGEHSVVARLFFDQDEVSDNDVVSNTIQIINREVSLHINEIKFLTENKEPEWIELVNLSTEKIFLRNWAISDLTDTVSIDSSLYLDSNEYIVLSKDSITKIYQSDIKKLIILNKFPTLNDQEDEISLIDPLGRWQEKVRYQRDWLEGEDFRYPSLERINPKLYENKSENWGPCVNHLGGTPGQKNSIFAELKNKEAMVEVSPNPFSPNADGIEDVTIIRGEIPETSARIKVEVYDTRGRLINSLIDNRFTGSHFNLVWDGRDAQGRIARIGIYILFIQALNDRLGVLREMKTTVVLAQKL